MSGLFKSKKEELPAPREVTTDLQKQSQERLAGFGGFDKPITPGADIFGDLPAIAPDLPSELAIPGLLEGFIGRGQPATTSAATKQILDTLSGGFDPATSPFFKGLREGVLKESGEAATRLRQGTQSAGQFRSTGRIKQERKLEEETFSTIANIMASLAESERMNKLNILPTAFAAGVQEEGAPIRTLEAIRNFSLFPRRQAELETKRGDILRTRGEELSIAQILADPSSFLFQQPQFSTEASPFERMILPILTASLQTVGVGGGGGGQFTKAPSKAAAGGGSSISSIPSLAGNFPGQ